VKKTTLYAVNDKESEHYGKYVRKIYLSGDGRFACQTFDQVEKMFLDIKQLILAREFKNGSV